jgi:hypothetical protein
MFGGSSIYFGGITDYLTVPQTADIDFGTGDFTMECWCYVPTFSSAFSLISREGNTGASLMTLYVQGPEGNNKFKFSIHDSNGSNAGYAVSTSNVPLNAWTHLAVVRSGIGLYLFVNGFYEGGGGSAANLVGSNPLVIGCEAIYGERTSNFTGYLDDVRITKGVARYTAPFIPPTMAFPNTSVPTGPTVPTTGVVVYDCYTYNGGVNWLGKY